MQIPSLDSVEKTSGRPGTRQFSLQRPSCSVSAVKGRGSRVRSRDARKAHRKLKLRETKTALSGAHLQPIFYHFHALKLPVHASFPRTGALSSTDTYFFASDTPSVGSGSARARETSLLGGSGPRAEGAGVLVPAVLHGDGRPLLRARECGRRLERGAQPARRPERHVARHVDAVAHVA